MSITQNRLNLGCGVYRREGWTNIGLDVAMKPDLQINFKRIAQHFSPLSCSHISIIHSIAYLREWEVLQLLRDARVLLQDGGEIEIEFPDVVKCAKRIVDDPSFENVRPLYGFDALDGGEYGTYKFAWSESSMSASLIGAGFRTVSAGTPIYHGPQPERDSRVTAKR